MHLFTIYTPYVFYMPDNDNESREQERQNSSSYVTYILVYK